MGKYFPKLTQTHVFIQTDEKGGGFNCPMLPVSALKDMAEFSDAMSKAESVAELDAVRIKMLALAKSVIPEEYQPNLDRLDIPKLTELIAYLMYGDAANDDQPKETPPKN